MVRFHRRLTLAVAAMLVAGCAGTAANPPSVTADKSGGDSAPTSEQRTPLGSPFSGSRGNFYGDPLIIDRADMRLGTTIQYGRIPNASELHDLTLLPGVSRLLLSLEAWPEFSRLEPLDQMPEGMELIVVVPGWPPGRAAVDAWNYLRVPVRAIVVVPGPPNSIEEVTNLNLMRSLERVIAQMDEPSRSGFERLQRPLSFRKLME